VPKVSTTMILSGHPPGRYPPAMAYRTGATHQLGSRSWPGPGPLNGHSRPILGSPYPGVHHSTTSFVASSFEAGVPDLGDVGAEAVAVWSLDRPGRDRPAGDRWSGPATATRPPQLGQPWRSARRTADPHPCARSAWNPKTISPSSKADLVLKISSDPPARTVAIVLYRCASNSGCANPGSARSTSRHAVTRARDHIDPAAGPWFRLAPSRLFNPTGPARQSACHRESVREAECRLCTPSATVN
jgi:hypothetical protein